QLSSRGIEEQRVRPSGNEGVVRTASEDDRPDLLAKAGAARLSGQPCPMSAPLERRDQALGLEGLPRALRPLERDESPVHAGSVGMGSGRPRRWTGAAGRVLGYAP